MSATVRYSRGVWVVDVSQTIGGKRKRSIKAFGAGAKAKRAAEAYRDEMAPAAKHAKYFERQTLTFRALWEKFAAAELAGTDRAPSTVADYRAIGRLYLLPMLGDQLVDMLDVDFWLGFKTRLQTLAGSKAAGKEGSGKPLSPRSVAKVLILAGQVFRYGRRIKLVSDNPLADVRKPKAAKRQPYIMDAVEIPKLRDALHGPRDRALIELIIMAGPRSGEVRGLRWPSLDLNGCRMFLEHAVTRRGEDGRMKTENALRTVPLPAHMIADLRRWKIACPPTAQDLVFPGEPNEKGERGPIKADDLLRKILRPALRRAGLPPAITVHDLRHQYGSLLHEAGVSLKRAQELMGHASERTTLAIYTHSMRRKHDDSADRIAGIAGLAPPPKAGNKWETSGDLESRQIAQLVEKMAPRVGLEPTTNGLTVRRSTN